MSINVNFGAGDGSIYYDEIVSLTGGMKLDGAFFNSLTYLEARSGILGVSTYTYTLSFWYKIASDLPNLYEDNRPVFSIQDCQCNLYGLSVWMQRDVNTEEVHLNIFSSAEDQAQRSQFYVENIPTHDDTWHHVAIYQKSWDLTTKSTIRKVYIDGVAQTIGNISIINRDVDFYFGNQWRVAGGFDIDVPNRFHGCLDEIYFTIDDFDIGISGNLDKLYDSVNNYPIYLGAIGERPTKKQALIYMRDEGEGLPTNYGNLGFPFSTYGELPLCSDIYPEDPDNPDINPCILLFDDPNIFCGWVIRNPRTTNPYLGTDEQEGVLDGWEIIDPGGPIVETASTYLTGSGTTIVSSKNGTSHFTSDTYVLSFWYNIAPADSAGQKVIYGTWDATLSGGTLLGDIEFWGTGLSTVGIFLWMTTDDGASYIDESDQIPGYADGNWHHIVISQKSSTDRTQVYCDGAALTGMVAYSTGTNQPFRIGQEFMLMRSGNIYQTDDISFKGCINHLYFSLEDIDLSIPDNLAKFYNSESYPVPMGDQGELPSPTSTPAYVYSYGGATDILNNWGSAADFTITTGSISDCPSDSPSIVLPPITAENILYASNFQQYPANTNFTVAQMRDEFNCYYDGAGFGKDGKQYAFWRNDPEGIRGTVMMMQLPRNTCEKDGAKVECRIDFQGGGRYGVGVEDCWLSYDVYFSDNWFQGPGTKLPGLLAYGINGPLPNVPPDGSHASGRVMIWGDQGDSNTTTFATQFRPYKWLIDGEISASAYYYYYNNDGRENFMPVAPVAVPTPRVTSSNPNDAFHIPIGEWVNIKLHFVMNTGTNSNGICRYYINNVLHWDHGGIQWRDDNQWPGRVTWNLGYFAHFWGGGTTAWRSPQDRDQQLYIDNIIITDGYNPG